MISIKTPQELESMRKGGKILADTLFAVLDKVAPGVSELELDAYAEELIRKKGGEPGFMKVPGYTHTVCMSTNNVVVHGIPSAYKLKEGDIIGIDCGVFFEGLHTDMSETIRVSRQSSAVSRQQDEVDIFLATGKRALEQAILQAKVGNRVGHISRTIQEIIENAGYSVVRSLIGHGVGKKLHEEPEIPGFLSGSIEKTPLLKPGMTIAIEAIYNMGKHDVKYDRDDGWTIVTADGSLSGVFERTVAITDSGPLVLTK